MRNVTRAALAVMLFAAAPLAGCTTWATYPPIPGAVDVSDPTLAPIPELMAEGILAAHGPLAADDSGDEAEIIFNLPPDTPISAFRSVRRRIPGSRWMEPGDVIAYHVHEVRLRMLDAEVDIIYAPAGGAHQMTTFSFKNKGGWKLDRRRDWGMRVHVPDANAPLPAGMKPGDMRAAEPEAQPEPTDADPAETETAAVPDGGG